MKIFRAEWIYRYTIEEYEFIRDTEKFVVTKDKNGFEIKNSKQSSNHKYFWNYDEAKQFLMYKIDLRIQGYKSNIDRHKSEKQKINNLQVKTR